MFKNKISTVILLVAMLFSSVTVNAIGNVVTYPVLNQSFDYSLTYSGVQGGYNWYYMYATIGANDYLQMPAYVQTDAYGSGGWKKSTFNWDYGIIAPSFIASGGIKDPVLAYKAPTTGVISIDMVGGLLDKRTAGDGMRMNIYKDGSTRTKLFPSDSNEFYDIPFTLNTNVVTPFQTLSNISVTAGDMIYIRINKGAGNATTSNDNIYLTPKITYTTMEGVYLPQDYFMLNMENGVGEQINIPYSGTGATSFAWASSNTNVATVSNTGRVTAVGLGSATITFTASNATSQWVSIANIDVVNKINPQPFSSGDVIGLWGDSITHAGAYGHNIATFYATKYPNIVINIPEFGYSGDNTQDILNRVDRDFDTRTDINKATIMLGANDVAIENTATNNYALRLRAIVDKLKAKGVTEITIFTPTPYDGIRSGNMARAKQVKDFAYDARKVASDVNCAVVDTWTELMYYDTILKTGYDVSPTMPTVLGDDNLHPRDLGHMLIARALLKVQGVMPLNNNQALPQLTLNATTSTFDVLQNATVSGLTVSPSSIAFSYTPSLLAYPITAGYTEIAKVLNIADELKNYDLFKITGLESGDYNVDINGTPMGKINSKLLQQGIDLAADTNSPIQTYSKSIATKIDDIHTLDFYLITNILIIETKFLGLTGVVSVADGTAAANAKVITTGWTTSMRDSYITAKGLEATKRQALADTWQSLYSLVNNRTYSVRVTKASTIATHYDASADLDGVQGKNGWYYRYIPVGNFSLTSYADINFFNTTSKYWIWKTTSESYQYGRIRNLAGSVDQQPGNNGDSARVFVAPAGGRIKITTKDGKIKELGSSDVARFRIYKNSQVIYPTDGSWLTMKINDVVTFSDLTVDVSEGDQIIFRVNKGSNAQSNTLPDSEGNIAKNDGDKVSYIPVIDYLEISNTPFAVYEPTFSRVGNNLNIKQSIKNATVSPILVKVAIAKYTNNKLVNLMFVDSDLSGYLTSFDNTIAIDDCTTVKIFVWDGFNSIIPKVGTSTWNK